MKLHMFDDVNVAAAEQTNTHTQKKKVGGAVRFLFLKVLLPSEIVVSCKFVILRTNHQTMELPEIWGRS